MKAEELTDRDINHLVYQACGGFSKALPDYCNDPAYSWPIIFENEISIGVNESEFGFNWIAASTTDDHLCNHDNPLRAAMIVYLKLKECL